MDYERFKEGFQDALKAELAVTRQYKRVIRGENDFVSIPCQMINCFCMFSKVNSIETIL